MNYLDGAVRQPGRHAQLTRCFSAVAELLVNLFRNGSTMAHFTISCIKSSDNIEDSTLKSALIATLNNAFSEDQTGGGVFFQVYCVIVYKANLDSGKSE